jgi:hypothetical protein
VRDLGTMRLICTDHLQDGGLQVERYLPFTSALTDDCDSPAENGRLAGIPDKTARRPSRWSRSPRWFVIVAWPSVGPDLCLFLPPPII